jgi:hypothetical protein
MTQKKKNYLIIAIPGLIIFIFIISMILPLFRNIQENSKELVEQKKALIQLEEKEKSFKRVENQYRSYRPNLTKIDSLFIDAETPISFVEFLEKAAADSNLSISINPGTTRKLEKDFWPSTDFQLILMGSFPNFLSFLERLESSFYLIEISNLNVERLTEEQIKEGFLPGDIKATMPLKVFSR